MGQGGAGRAGGAGHDMVRSCTECAERSCHQVVMKVGCRQVFYVVYSVHVTYMLYAVRVMSVKS